MEWNKRNTARLKQLRELGKSFTEIADELGCSKSTIAGKVYRLRGHGTVKVTRKPAPWESLPTPRVNECEWPFGDVGNPDFHFCGQKTRTGQSYCEEHYRKAHEYVTVERSEWTEKRLEVLRMLVSAGVSGRQIAPKVGMSPSSVNTKIRELGLR